MAQSRTFTSILTASLVCVVAYLTLNIAEHLAHESKPSNDDESIYYFGHENTEQTGRNLANTYPDGSCYVNHFKCLNNADHLIQQFTALTPYDCCKQCLNHTSCVAYNHLYINATNETQYIINDHPQCQLFSTFPNDTRHVYSGNCVMGTPYDKTRYSERPNYVFYFPDTIRMESMSIYHHPLRTTPNIQQFAQSGITFNNHIAQHSQCSPSRNAMMTGRYMHVSGHRTQSHLIQYWEPNYFRWLKDSGYYILWLGKNDALSRESFPLSVNEWHDLIGVCRGSNVYRYPQAGYFSFLSTGCDTYGNSSANGDYKAVLYAQAFLQSNPPQPFFIFIPGIGAHPPYGAPLDYQTKFDPSEVKQKAPLRPPYVNVKPKYHSKTAGIPYWRNLTGFDDALFYKINSIYLGRVSYMDWIFGELMNAIDTFDEANDDTTGVIMSSDHGDFAGDYHLVEKWPGGADDVLLRIPLVMRMPNGKANVTVNASTANLDILRTLLDLAHIDVEFVSFGESLRDSILNGKERDLKRFVYSEGGFSANHEVFPNGSDHITSPQNLYWPRAQEEMSANGHGSPRWVAMRNIYYKLVFRPLGVSELYDLQKDPRQLSNVWNSNDDTYKKIKMQCMTNLTAWFVETADVTPMLMDSRGVPKQVPN